MAKPQEVKLTLSQAEQSRGLQIKQQVDLAVAKLQQGNADMAVALLKRTLQTTPVQFPGYDVITHNLSVAYKQLIEEMFKAPDVTPITPFAREVLALELRGHLAGDVNFRSAFADTFHKLGLVFYRHRQHEVALHCFRKAIAIQPCPSYYVDLTMSVAYLKTPARLVDYTTALKPEQLGRHIFITCVMKSGSTFLKNTLVKLTGFKDMFSVFASLQNEHELDLPIIAKFAGDNTVTQQHARASEANLQLMQAFGIRPVVLVRNVYDSVISLLDFYRSGFTFSTYFDRDDFLALAEEDQIELIIDNAIPWYFQFVASWQRVERERRLQMHWLTYEELIADKPGTIEQLLAFYGIAAPRSAIEEAIHVTEADNANNRFNKGVAGRGKAGLTPQQKERVTRLARYYPKIDFGCLGL